MQETKVPELGGITVELTCAGQTTRETGRLLGAAAMVVDSAARPALQSEAQLRFRPRPGSPMILARGVVAAHLEDKGIRIQFTDLPEEHRRHLLELLYPSGEDRRASKRASLVTQIRTTVGGETLVGYTRDISTGGVFIETEHPAEKGSEVTLRFKLSPDSPILEARAVVAYSLQGDGMGLRFLNLPSELRAVLESFVQQQ